MSKADLIPAPSRNQGTEFLSKWVEYFYHKDTKTRSLMNAKCRVQNEKVKIKGYEIMA
jgi:hypothetical protein